MKDLTAHRFGRLTALAPTSERYKTCVVWRCRCDCGKECLVPSTWLLRGQQRSCGCLQDETRRRDITGETRGQLTAIRPTGLRRSGRTIWEWRCTCGALVYKPPQMVKPGSSTMCPACAKALKSRQAAAMAAGQQRDDETGLMPAYLDGLREGRPARNNTSGVRGVTWHAGTKKWQARMQVDGRTVSLGYYTTIEEAAEARRKAVEKRYGKPQNEE